MTLKPWRLAAVAAAMLVATAVMPSHAQVEAAKAAAIKPFKAHVPDGVLDDLRRRLFMSSAAKTTLETDTPSRSARVGCVADRC